MENRRLEDIRKDLKLEDIVIKVEKYQKDSTMLSEWTLVSYQNPSKSSIPEAKNVVGPHVDVRETNFKFKTK